MVESPHQETWCVRPPWLDEAERAAEHFVLPGPRPVTRRVWFWALVAGDLERLVGFIELAEDVLPDYSAEVPPVGRMEYFLRDRWAGTEGARTLLKTALEKGTQLGLTHFTSQADPASPFAGLLREAGFVGQPTQEVWLCPIAAPIVEQEPRVDRMLRRYPIPVTPLQPAHLEAVRRICSQLKLLTPARVALLDPSEPASEGFDPRFSFLAGDPTNPAAVLLARVSAGQLYIEVMARNPAAPTASPIAVAALLKAAMPAARDAGLEQLSCVFRSAETSPVLALLQRGGAKYIRRFAFFLRAPSPAAS